MADIFFRGGNRDYIRPEIDDIFILHKPDYNVIDKIDLLTWYHSYDKYDGMRLRITREGRDPGNTVHGVYWSGVFENGDKALFECFDINWFEKVHDYDELDDAQLNIDFFDI